MPPLPKEGPQNPGDIPGVNEAWQQAHNPPQPELGDQFLQEENFWVGQNAINNAVIQDPFQQPVVPLHHQHQNEPMEGVPTSEEESEEGEDIDSDVDYPVHFINSL